MNPLRKTENTAIKRLKMAKSSTMFSILWGLCTTPTIQDLYPWTFPIFAPLSGWPWYVTSSSFASLRKRQQCITVQECWCVKEGSFWLSGSPRRQMSKHVAIIYLGHYSLRDLQNEVRTKSVYSAAKILAAETATTRWPLKETLSRYYGDGASLSM